jgi:glycosyltransferase involved in cell wall biosynthesis
VISVVVPVRDGLPHLEEQLRALDAQRYDAPYEVIVADNGSSDGTVAFARDWAASHPNVRLVDASSVRGPAAARNAGVAAAHGELLAFCDADDVVHAGWLAGCAEALRTSDLAAGSFDFWSLNGHPPGPPIPAATHQLGFLPAGLGANLATRRGPFEEVGGFDVALVRGEDIDLCWRMQLHGFTFAEAPDAVVSKRDRSDPRGAFEQAYAFGQCGPLLHRRFRAAGARRDLRGAGKAWLWLLSRAYLVVLPSRRTGWVRAAGIRIGRVVGSVRLRVFFP